MPEEQPLKRWFPRRKVSIPCSVSSQNRQVRGRTVDVSYAGVGFLLSEAVDVNAEVVVQMPEGIQLRARPVYLQQDNGEKYLVGCKIEFIERGEQQWMNLCYVPRW
ncbi:MAG TPA: PilZ domain-containing protein [Nitrospirales bacterium]|nr:PilZ domain-containing protein [Nitrospirales bacterium]